MDKQKKHSKKKIGAYIIGSIATAFVAFRTMPKFIDVLSTKLYKINSDFTESDSNDFGPEIVRKDEEEKGD